MTRKILFMLSALFLTSCNEQNKEKQTPLSCTQLLDQFGNKSLQYIANSCNGNEKINAPGSNSTVLIRIRTETKRIDENKVEVSNNICTGVAITDNTILTAAHCLYYEDQKTKTVKKIKKDQIIILAKSIGDDDFTNNSNVVLVKEIHENEIYDSEKNSKKIPLADIAILKTDRSLSKINIFPTKIAKNYIDGEKAISIGFGQTMSRKNNTNDKATALIKRWASTTVRAPKKEIESDGTDLQTFNNAVNNGIINQSIAPTIKDTFIILSKEHISEGQICNGDSGGPQFVKRNNTHALLSITQGMNSKIIGSQFISNNDDCSAKDSNNTYVYPYTTWIQNILNESHELLEY